MDWFLFTCVVSSLLVGFEFYLDSRQIKSLQQQDLPKELEGLVQKPVYTKILQWVSNIWTIV
jgi:hypothetical protein